MAAGDITPTTPRQDTGLALKAIHVSAEGYVQLDFVDGFGRPVIATVRNGVSTGFDYASGTPVTVTTPTGFTDMIAAMGLTGAKRSAVVTAAKNAGIIAVTGTVA